MKRRARQQPAAKPSPGRTAVMYVRVSSKEQEQRFSIPAQRHLLSDYALREGIHVVQEFEDVETAKRVGRKDTKFRADVAERIGLGFELPNTEKVEVVPNAPDSPETEVAASI